MARRGSLTLQGGGSVISGAVAGVGGQAIVYVVGIPTSVLIARALGPEGRGEYYLPVIASMVAMAVFQISLETANQVAVSEERISLGRLLRGANALALMLAPPAVAAMVGAYFLGRSTVFENVELGDFLIAAATVPVGIHLVWLGSLLVIGRRILRQQVALVTGSTAYLVAAAVLYALDELAVTEVLVLYGASIALPWLLCLGWSREFGSLTPSIDRDLIGWILGVALRFHAAHLALYLLLKVDLFLVAGLLDVEDVGIYSLAVLLADPLWVGTNALVQGSVPFQLSRSQAEATRLAFKAARFNFALTATASVAIAATCWAWIPALFGAGFDETAPALALLLPGVCALSAARPLMIVLPRTGRAALYASIAAGALAVNCALNVVLLPEVGVIGASISSSLAYALVAAFFLAWGLRLAELPARAALLPQPDDRDTLRRVAARLRPGS